MLDPQQISDRLQQFLETKLSGVRTLASGWETTVFEFMLAASSPKIPVMPVGRPLVLRFYQGTQADDKGRREHLTIERLSAVGYSVPRPYVYEADHAAIGAPFLILERLPGGPLFATKSFPQAFKTFSLGFFGFVRAQVRLHRLNPEAPGLRDIPRAFQTPAAPRGTPLLDRVLAIIAERVERGPLPGLRDALGRLAPRAGAYRVAEPSIVHMDYHPLNAVVQGTHLRGIIDWVNTDVGDRHLDVVRAGASALDAR
jgi:aminoglycoside phosphotransferase (APT) family kinase protein